MSLDNTDQAAPTPPVEAPEADGAGGGRRMSMWFLLVPVALTFAAAALAFFLLSPGDEELMTTTDQAAVDVAVANARPAEPAFTRTPATPTSTPQTTSAPPQ